jgi:hypothetical protein
VQYIRLPTHLGDIVVRDVAEADLDALVAYWHGGGADLDFLGIDLERPDGLAGPGEFNIYVVEASAVDDLLARRLGMVPQGAAE